MWDDRWRKDAMTLHQSRHHAVRIDSHQHFWDLSRLSYHWMPPGPGVLKRNYLPSDLLPLLTHNGIDMTVAVQAHQSVEETEWLLELSHAHHFIAGIVAWAPLSTPDLPRVLERYCQHPEIVGIRHIAEDEPDDNYFLYEDVIRGLKEVARAGLAYDVLVKPRHLKSIPRLAERVPGLRMVVDHIAKPFIKDHVKEPWASDIAAVARIPGVYCKLSGIVTEADHRRWALDDLRPYVHKVVDLFGFDRLMFGSDWPVCLLAGSYTRVLRSYAAALGPVPDGDRDKVFGLNARDFYRLPVGRDGE